MFTRAAVTAEGPTCEAIRKISFDPLEAVTGEYLYTVLGEPPDYYSELHVGEAESTQRL